MDTLIDFATMPWRQLAAGSRCKEAVRGDSRVRLLELSAGFVEPDWCTNGHAGRVLEGALTLRTRTGLDRLAAGDVFVIEAGEVHAHKAEIAAGQRALLLLFEQAGG